VHQSKVEVRQDMLFPQIGHFDQAQADIPLTIGIQAGLKQKPEESQESSMHPKD
jgi:hypothetical protein